MGFPLAEVFVVFLIYFATTKVVGLIAALVIVCSLAEERAQALKQRERAIKESKEEVHWLRGRLAYTESRLLLVKHRIGDALHEQ